MNEFCCSSVSESCSQICHFFIHVRFSEDERENAWLTFLNTRVQDLGDPGTTYSEEKHHRGYTHSSFTSHFVESILKLTSIFKHVQFHHFILNIHVVEKFFCHCAVRTRCFWENHHTIIRNCFLKSNKQKNFFLIPDITFWKEIIIIVERGWILESHDSVLKLSLHHLFSHLQIESIIHLKEMFLGKKDITDAKLAWSDNNNNHSQFIYSKHVCVRDTVLNTWPFTSSCKPHYNPEIVPIIISTLQMGKVRHIGR